MGHFSLKGLRTIPRGCVWIPTAFPGRSDRMDAAEPQQGKPWQRPSHGLHLQQGPTQTQRHCPRVGTVPSVQGRDSHRFEQCCKYSQKSSGAVQPLTEQPG